ncbi:MAG: 4Fe-4S dicluster domain-containing protein [Armatimonadetes bacterium]|nr:4Fe-4S dicluster domain-containing protein [Armatimonadota bacterium]
MRVNFDFKEELAATLEGASVNLCYQCGACTGDCPSARFHKDFNPREIMLKVLLGMRDDLIREDSIIWNCSSCYNCHERCPQSVKPVEIIIELKNLLAREGIFPKGVKETVEAIKKTGRSTIVTDYTHKMRESLGLPPLTSCEPGELSRILEP